MKENEDKREKRLANVSLSEWRYSEDQYYLMKEEYKTLHGELLKHGENSYRVLSFMLITAGIIITIGLLQAGVYYILFLFPVICFFMARLWKYNIEGTGRICSYIRSEIENNIFFGKQGVHACRNYENNDKRRSPLLTFIRNLFMPGMFLAVEIIVMALGILKSNFTAIDRVMIVLGAFFIFLTLAVLFPNKFSRSGEHG